MSIQTFPSWGYVAVVVASLYWAPAARWLREKKNPPRTWIYVLSVLLGGPMAIGVCLWLSPLGGTYLELGWALSFALLVNLILNDLVGGLKLPAPVWGFSFLVYLTVLLPLAMHTEHGFAHARAGSFREVSGMREKRILPKTIAIFPDAGVYEVMTESTRWVIPMAEENVAAISAFGEPDPHGSTGLLLVRWLPCEDYGDTKIVRIATHLPPPRWK